MKNYEIINILLFHHWFFSTMNSYCWKINKKISLCRVFYFWFIFAIYFIAIDMSIDITFSGDSFESNWCSYMILAFTNWIYLEATGFSSFINTYFWLQTFFSAQFLSSFNQLYENCTTSHAENKIFAANMFSSKFCVIFFK